MGGTSSHQWEGRFWPRWLWRVRSGNWIQQTAVLQYMSCWNWVGMKFKMVGMNPNCCHPKPRPTIFWHFPTKMEFLIKIDNFICTVCHYFPNIIWSWRKVKVLSRQLKIFKVKIFRGEYPQNPYALKVQNMCIKGVSNTFSSVLFLPEVGRGRQNTICQQK